MASADATLNYTAVEEKRQENAFNLSTIIEETGSYKSSSSNATGSSGGGSLPTDSLTPCRSLVNSPHVVNPFLPEQVNAMLNSQRLSVAQGSLTHVSMELPKQMKNVCMCGEVYPTRKLTSGGFATIYTTKDKSGVTHLHHHQATQPTLPPRDLCQGTCTLYIHACVRVHTAHVHVWHVHTSL